MNPEGPPAGTLPTQTSALGTFFVEHNNGRRQNLMGGAFDPNAHHALPQTPAMASAPMRSALNRPADPTFRPAPIHGPDTTSWNPLMMTALKAGSDWQSELPTAMAHNALNAVNAHGQTALMLAAINGHTSMARGLLGAGANPDMRCAQGRTVFSWATAFGKSDTLAGLCEHASPNQIGSWLSQRDNSGLTPLGISARNGQDTLGTLLKIMEGNQIPLDPAELNQALEAAAGKLSDLRQEVKLAGFSENTIEQRYGGDPMRRAIDNVVRLEALQQRIGMMAP